MSYPVKTDAPIQSQKQGNSPNSNEGTLRGRNVEYTSALGPVDADRFRDLIGYNEIKNHYEDSSEEDLDTIFAGINNPRFAELFRAHIEAKHAKNAKSFVAESTNGK